MSDRDSFTPNRALLQRLNELRQRIASLEQRSTWTASVHSVREDDFEWFSTLTPPELQTPFAPDNPPEPSTQYEMLSLRLPAGRWVISVMMQQTMEGYPGITPPPIALTLWTKITVDGVTAEAYPLAGVIGALDPQLLLEVARTFTFPAVLNGDGAGVQVFVAATTDDLNVTTVWFMDRITITAFPG